MSVAVGDFNNDGVPDFAVANYLGNSITIMMGSGNGWFAVGETTAAWGSGPIGVGSFPFAIAIGDFNRDGRQDLAVVNEGEDSASILLGDGTGELMLSHTYTVGSAPCSITTGDFNQDGIADLAVANIGDHSATVLKGNGDVTFGNQGVYAAGVYPKWINAGDFNRDGYPDLALANYYGASVSVLLADSHGNFQQYQTYPAGSNPDSIVVGDFDNDGNTDLAVASDHDVPVTVLKGGGDGSFSEKLWDLHPVGDGPMAMVSADLTGDGRLDLIVHESEVAPLSDGGGGEKVRDTFCQTEREATEHPRPCDPRDATHSADRTHLRRHQRTQAGRRAAHASGVALAYRPRFRSGDPASLHVLEEPPRTVSGVEPVSGVV